MPSPRSLFVVAVLALCACSVSDQYSSTAFSQSVTCTANVCTASAPTSSTDAGAQLGSVDGFRVQVCAPVGQAIQDAGEIDFYYCDSVNANCIMNPGLTQFITTSGKQCLTVPDFKAGYISDNADSVVAAPNGMVINGAGPVTVRIYTHRERYK